MLTPQELSASQFSGKGVAYATSKGHADPHSLSKLVQLVNPCGEETMLDVATGGGHLAHIFAPHIRNVIAFDLVNDMLVQARQKDIALVRGKAESLPFADESFDLVGCRLAAHHFANIDSFLTESHRVLRPGGKLLIVDVVVPEESDVSSEINRIEKLRDPSHGRNLSLSEWSNQIRSASFSVIHSAVAPFGNGLRMEFEDWTRRIGTPQENLSPLREAMTNADAALKAALRLQVENETITFELDEGTILATRV